MATTVLTPGRSLLRWTGGKQWLARSLGTLLDQAGGKHVEPFAGAASVFFARARHQGAWLNDANAELMTFYRCLSSSPAVLAERLHMFQTDSATYYEVRAARPVEEVDRAARFLYLNRTGFAGLWRVNKDGVYNVPYGRLSDPWLPAVSDLEHCAAKLSQVRLTNLDFRDVLKRVDRDALLYIDPPYSGASESSSSFNRYTSTPFTSEDHLALARECNELASDEGRIVLSLSSHSHVTNYSNDQFVKYRRHVRNDLGSKHRRTRRTEFLLISRNVPADLGAPWVRAQD